jgi:hypothetical protein
MVEQIVAKLRGREWVGHIDVFQNASTGDIEVRGESHDEDSLRSVYGEAYERLQVALADRVLIAELQRDGQPVSLPAIFWKAGAAEAILRDEKFEGHTFWVRTDCFEQWLHTLSPAITEVAAPASGAFKQQEKISSSRRARPESEIWKAARNEALRWLEDEGAPQFHGDQAKLEKHIAEFTTRLGHCFAESTVRKRVVEFIECFKQQPRFVG